MREQRGAPNQLGIALQLGALRWLGFIPEDLTAAPPDAAAALSLALDVAARVIFDYAVRAPTRVEHRLLVRAHADFRAFSERDLEGLQARLVEVALEHERPSLLLVQICELCATSGLSAHRSTGSCGWSAGCVSARTSRPSSDLSRSSPSRSVDGSTGSWSLMEASRVMRGCGHGRRA